ncbi:MAG: hypothetical protein O9972_65425, partial [Burkholderiales bacterium]|nr:hypothetical protein [Burkholderiales bacterium]
PFRVWARVSPIVPAKAAAVAKETAHTRVRVAVENIINFPVEESCTIGKVELSSRYSLRHKYYF